MLSSSMLAQTLAKRGWQGSGLTVENWWESAVFYQADPLTFQDTRRNGSGCASGIVSRLDYLQSLEVDALILSPTPLEVAGSTRAINRTSGSEEDLDTLVQEASRRHMRVLVDLPFNSTLSGEETVNAARFWFSRGIAGLRLTDPDPRGIPLTAAQASSRLSELERLCAEYPGKRVLFWDLPESMTPDLAFPFQVSHPRRRSSPRQTSTPTITEAEDALSKGPQLVSDDRLLQLNRWKAADLVSLLTDRSHILYPLAKSVVASDTSSRPRSFGRFSDGAHPMEIARQTAALLLLGQAAPELYAGQEIGMQTASGGIVPSSSVAAPGKTSHTQWDGTPGFTSGISQLPPDPNATHANIASVGSDAGSLLNWYRRLSSLRHANLALRSGSLNVLNTPESDLVVWIRRPPTGAIGGEPVVIVCNISPRAVTVSLSAELRARGVPVGTGLLRTLASSSPGTDLNTPVPLQGIALAGYGVYVGELSLQPGLESVPAPARHRSNHSSRVSSTRGE